MKHPIQPIYENEHGAPRFKENKIIRDLVNREVIDLHDLAQREYPDEDWQQLAQLMGYSLSGYSELPYVDDAAYYTAELKWNNNSSESDLELRVQHLEQKLNSLKTALRIPMAELFGVNSDDLSDET